MRAIAELPNLFDFTGNGSERRGLLHDPDEVFPHCSITFYVHERQYLQSRPAHGSAPLDSYNLSEGVCPRACSAFSRLETSSTTLTLFESFSTV